MTFSRRDRAEIACARALGPLALRLLGRSLRWHVQVDAGTSAHLERSEAVIYALWHGHLLPLAYARRGRGIHVLVSLNKDGELITVVLHAMGFRTIRGSTSRNARAALKRLVSTGRRGGALAITPDGPRGPRHIVQDGVVTTAALTGLPVLPIAAACTPAWQLSSWDRFIVPKPFARVGVAMGPLIHVPRDGGRAPERWTHEIGAALHSASDAARALVGAPGDA